MEIVCIFNGLGNQLSQYAFYLKKKSMGQNVTYIFENTGHNGIELERLFGITKPNIFQNWIMSFMHFVLLVCRTPKYHYFGFVKFVLNKLGIHEYVEGMNYEFQEHFLREANGLTFYTGGWHHPDYFKDMSQIITTLYKFPEFKKKENIEIANEARKANAVAVHVRRGDYMDGYLYEVYGSVCSEKYYRNAITYVEDNISNPIFYVFSNDIEWSKRLFVNKNAVYVDWNKGVDSWADMALMSKFSNIIIANSTFSWWAAWLGKIELVLCPTTFVNTNKTSGSIYPESWIRINS